MAPAKTFQPTKKEIVSALMTFVGKETKSVFPRGSQKPIVKEYLKYRCPKPTCTSPVLSFMDKTGLNNPYAHIRSCYGKGMSPPDQDCVLIELFKKAREASRAKGGTIRSHFDFHKLSEYESAVYGYVRLIVKKNLPIYFVCDPEVRRFSRFAAHVGRETLVEVILKLVELVEKRVAVEMNGTKGAVIFNGWTCNNTHFIAVIASYCTKSCNREENALTVKTVPRLTLLALSPMGQVLGTEKDSVVTDETASFNAEAHVQFFTEIFSFFGQDFATWCVCLIGDNCNTNLKVAAITRKKYVGCNSHKLNLEVNAMIEFHPPLRRTIESVHGTMKSARKLKNAALLRNLTTLSPIMHNASRWSGKLEMLQRFERIRGELIAVRDDSEGDVMIDTSTALLARTTRFVQMLREIDVGTKSLQTRGHTLAASRDDLDVLLEAVAEQREEVHSPLYQCKLGTKFISGTASIVRNPSFESRVVKLQKGLEQTLTDVERSAVDVFRESNFQSIPEVQDAGRSGMPERLAKKRKHPYSPDRYMESSFVVGSVAEVERLWSIAKHVLTDNRKAMTPQLFEAIMFLKVNERFWDAQLVSEAIQSMRSDRVVIRLQQHLAQEEGT